MADIEQPRPRLRSNGLVVIVLWISCLLFIGVWLATKNKVFKKVIPTMRGEVTLDNNFVITTIKNRYPIIINRKDPFVGKQLRYRGNVKSLFAEAATNLCKPKDNIVEIGAHYGVNTILLSQKLLEGSGKYYAIEANSRVASYLTKNVVLNDLTDKVTVISKAIADHDGDCDIKDILSYKKKKETKTYEIQDMKVKCEALDHVLPKENIQLLMVDIPGMEFSIIKGAKALIERSEDIKILVNCNVNESTQNLDVERELMNLQSSGFHFFEVNNELQYNQVSIEEILAKKNLVMVIQEKETL